MSFDFAGRTAVVTGAA